MLRTHTRQPLTPRRPRPCMPHHFVPSAPRSTPKTLPLHSDKEAMPNQFCPRPPFSDGTKLSPTIVANITDNSALNLPVAPLPNRVLSPPRRFSSGPDRPKIPKLASGDVVWEKSWTGSQDVADRQDQGADLPEQRQPQAPSSHRSHQSCDPVKKSNPSPHPQKTYELCRQKRIRRQNTRGDKNPLSLRARERDP